MTSPLTHTWRLLKWGRILARHGALRGIERDPNTPPRVKRLARIARFGARVPKVPRYADAFQAIGPAAIKLGQTLATRPDLVGEQAAHDLMRLQDALPPVPYADIREVDRKYQHPRADFEVFMKHLLHILQVVGPEHVGIGADWDGGGGVTGLEDVSQLPRITQRLVDAGYSEQDLANIWGGNLLRVLDQAQTAANPAAVENCAGG